VDDDAPPLLVPETTAVDDALALCVEHEVAAALVVV
jgi:CBS domain containing-hemolysin-like protein